MSTLLQECPFQNVKAIIRLRYLEVTKMSSKRSGSKCQLCHKNVLFKMTIDLEASGRTLTATYMKRLRGGVSLPFPFWVTQALLINEPYVVCG